MDKDKIELYAGEIKRIMDEALEIQQDQCSAYDKERAKINAFDEIVEYVR